MTSITFKLPTELRRELEAEAEKDGRTLSDYIRRHFQAGLVRTSPAPTPQKKGGKAR